LGIRYAQPPTGHLRWAPPRPVTPWKGVRSAEAYGNRGPALPSTNGPQSLTEDCLFLNVQRPAKTRSHERLPVYVWIHGGGLVNGSSNQHESGSCPSWPQADADSSADQVTSQVDCPATADPAAIACLRRVSVQALLDAGNNWNGPLLVSSTPTLPQDLFQAVTSGAFTRVPVLIGANRDEGRTFTQGDVDWTQQIYEQWVRDNFGPDADAVLAHYPWPATSDRWTGACLEAAILTDSGSLLIWLFSCFRGSLGPSR
jgi:carboxylesterase type B